MAAVRVVAMTMAAAPTSVAYRQMAAAGSPAVVAGGLWTELAHLDAEIAGIEPRIEAAAGQVIDAGGDLTKLSSPLLATLGALGLTLAARSGPQGRPQGASPAVDALAELRRRRAAR